MNKLTAKEIIKELKNRNNRQKKYNELVSLLKKSKETRVMQYDYNSYKIISNLDYIIYNPFDKNIYDSSID